MAWHLFCHAYSCGNFPFYIVGLSKQLTSARRSCLLKFLFCHFIVSGTWRRPIASLMSFDARRAADMSFPKVHVVHTSREPTKLHNSKGGYIWQLGPTFFFFLYWDLKDPSRTMNPPCGVSPPLFIQWKDCRSLSNLSRSKHTTHLVERIHHSF